MSSWFAAAAFNRNGHFGLFHDNFASAVAALLSVANFHFAYVGPFHLGASAPYWSLSLEEQFYLLLPLLVFVSGRHLFAVLLAALLVAFVLPEESTLFACCRVQPILLGVLLALLERTAAYRLLEPGVLRRSGVARAAVLLVPLLLMACLAPAAQQIVPYPYDAIAVLAAVLVFVASYGKNYTLADGRTKRVLLWLGSRSYALYLIHTPVFCAVNEAAARLYPRGTVFGNRFDVAFLVAGLGTTLGLAELNYRFVEQPLRRRGARIAQRFAEDSKEGLLF